MAWERRAGNRYYYQAQRVGDRIKKYYVGTGELACAAASLDAGKRAELEEQRSAERSQRDSLKGLDSLLEVLGEGIDHVIARAFTSAGYCRHKRGEWRKRRESRRQR